MRLSHSPITRFCGRSEAYMACCEGVDFST